MDHIVCDDMPAFSYESSHYQDIYPQVDPEASYSLHNYLHGPDDPYRSRVPHSPLPKNVSPTELMRMPVPIPSSRASSSQPVPRLKISKPRKNSVGEYSRKRKYEGEHIGDFKKFGRGTKEPSAESSSVFGNRWEELLEAAASASEADGQSRNQTPVSIGKESDRRHIPNHIKRIHRHDLLLALSMASTVSKHIPTQLRLCKTASCLARLSRCLQGLILHILNPFHLWNHRMMCILHHPIILICIITLHTRVSLVTHIHLLTPTTTATTIPTHLDQVTICLQRP